MLPLSLLWLALYLLLPRLVHFVAAKPDFGKSCCRDVEQPLTEYAVLAGKTQSHLAEFSARSSQFRLPYENAEPVAFDRVKYKA